MTLTYRNSIYGIEIEYPSNWEYWEKFHDVERIKTIVSFKPKGVLPLKKKEDIGKSLVLFTIAVDHLPYKNNNTFLPLLDTYTNESINNLKLTRALDPDFQILEPAKYTTVGIDQMKANKILLIMNSGGALIKTMMIISLKENIVYIINYAAIQALYSSYLQIVQKMIDSFRITK